MTGKQALSRAGVVLLVLVLVGGTAGYLYVVHGGMSARREPGSVEAWVAARLVNLGIPAADRAHANPFAAGATSDDVAAGRDLYQARCQSCHGADGTGRTAAGAAMFPTSRPRGPPVRSRVGREPLRGAWRNDCRAAGWCGARGGPVPPRVCDGCSRLSSVRRDGRRRRRARPHALITATASLERPSCPRRSCTRGSPRSIRRPRRNRRPARGVASGTVQRGIPRRASRTVECR